MSVNYDSNSFQFWASRMYRRGEFRAPYQKGFLYRRLHPSNFLATYLNFKQRGDQAAFVLS